MTRNTKIYKITVNKKDIYYRTLNVSEITMLNGINKPFYRFEMAAKLSLMNDESLDYPILQSIGKDVIERSSLTICDKDLYEITVENFRKSIETDEFITIIVKILQHLPNVSIEFLLNQTINDLIEYGCICEKLSNKRFFNFTNTSKIDEQNGHKYFQDDGKSLKEKMIENEKVYK